MIRKVIRSANTVAVSICATIMVVLGLWLPPMIEAPYPPKIELVQAKTQ
jgi:hypothetical protein